MSFARVVLRRFSWPKAGFRAGESVEERKERAKNSTSSEELEKLAQDEDWTVRSSVAANKKTPTSVLEKNWELRGAQEKAKKQ